MQKGRARRDTRAAKRLMHKLLKKQGFAPRVLVTAKLLINQPADVVARRGLRDDKLLAVGARRSGAHHLAWLASKKPAGKWRGYTRTYSNDA